MTDTDRDEIFTVEYDNGAWAVAHRGYSPFVEFDDEQDARAYATWRNSNDAEIRRLREALRCLVRDVIAVKKDYHPTLLTNWGEVNVSLDRAESALLADKPTDAECDHIRALGAVVLAAGGTVTVHPKLLRYDYRITAIENPDRSRTYQAHATPQAWRQSGADTEAER